MDAGYAKFLHLTILQTVKKCLQIYCRICSTTAAPLLGVLSELERGRYKNSSYAV